MRIVPVIAIRKRVRNRILKCAPDSKQERRRGKGNDDKAELMYKPPHEESNISIEEETKKEPQKTLKPSLEVLVNEYSDGFKALAQNEGEVVAVAQLENSTKKVQQQNEATLLPTRFVKTEERNTGGTEKKSVCLNEMDIHFKTLDELLQKAEQVIRLLEFEKQVKVKSDDTKCEKSHKLEVVDQLRADNDGKKGNSSQEERRAYLHRAVAKDFHRVGFNCDEAVINKFVEDLILDQERIRMEEENPKIEENYVLPTGNFMSYKWTGGHDPPKLPSSTKNCAANQKVLVEEVMPHQPVPRKPDPRDADIRESFLEMYQVMTKREIHDLNSQIADGLYSEEGWSKNEVDNYIADLLEEYGRMVDDPIDPDVQKYYMELLPRLSNYEQEYIINDIIAHELYKEGWNDDEVSGYIDDLYWQMAENQSYSNSTADTRTDTTLPINKKIIAFIRRNYLAKMKEPEELTVVAHNEIMNNMRWELSLVGLNSGEINQQVDALIEDNYQFLTEEEAASAAIWEPQPNKQWGSVRTDAYDRIVEEQRDTPAPAGTFCLGIPELESSKMEVVSRERTRTQTLGNKKNEQMKTTETTSKKSRRRKRPMRRRALQQPLYWQSTFHPSATLTVKLSARATLLLINACLLFQQHGLLTTCKVNALGGGWYPFCDGKWRVENDRIS